ncbi:hypothetical protein HGA11_07165 [Mycolicibacterium septicum DSM 44393]|uniref:Uncharacterized protein n=1 Tax=Mycolicibacterium septicum DSM 44393 TaxID=1341646 RepID=A0A7X6ML43_9MYCO|nr:hypothetical protein [Mycolicibacterium septicum]NKZ10757.1 hypothetical protein [Mycolicibacterium septicum DSM 44393]
MAVVKRYRVSSAAEAVRVAGSDLAEVLDSFAGCFGLERSSVAYVSTPITTGRRYYAWLATSKLSKDNPNFPMEHAREVIAVNQASAHALVLQARRLLGKIVVDPTGLKAPEWSQSDFHFFWSRLITDYVGTVVFNDGWEYSTGCTYEYAAALRAGATVLDAQMSVMPPIVAVTKTDEAIALLRGQGHAVQSLAVAQRQIVEAVESAG